MMPVRALSVLTLIAVGLLGLLPFAASAQQDDALNLAIRDTRLSEDGDTELVVNVTGSQVPAVLAGEAFSLSEDGQPVEDLQVEPLLDTGTANLAVALALDVSGSMAGEPMVAMREAAAGLAEELSEQGIRVQVIAFDGEVEVLTDFTDDTGELVDTILALEAGAGTKLYDSVITGVEQLATAGGQPTLVVFSDGADSASDQTRDDALAALEADEVPVTSVIFDTAAFDDDAADALEAFAEVADGRVVATEELDELEGLFAEVGADIASQYVLTYTSERHEPETLDLAVTVTVDDTEVSRQFVVPNPRLDAVDAPAPAIVEREPGIFSTPIVLIAGVAAAFVAIALLVLYLFSGVRTAAGRNLDEQLSRYIEQGDERAGRSSVVSAHFRDRATALLESTPRPKGLDAKLGRRLEQAAWPLRNGEFIALVVISGLFVGILTAIVVNLLGGILLGLIAAFVPFAILEIRRSRRRDAFLRQLPDTLQLMAGSLRAGHGVLQAIDSVSKEAGPPAAEEFGRVITEARLGMPIEDSLSEMAERIDNPDFRWVVLAINIQREVGGNLAELLDTVAEVLREREMLRRQISVLSAEGRLSAYVLIGLPIVLAIYLILVRPEYISTLVTSGLIGYTLVGGAVFLMLVGVIWIRKLIKIEV